MTKIKFDKCFTGNKKVSIEEGKTYYFAFIGKYVKGKPFPWKYLPQSIYYEPMD